MFRPCLLVSLLLPLPPLAAAAPPTLAVEEIESPGGPGSGEPFLGTDGNILYMSWLEEQGDEVHALRFARRTPDGWTQPGTIATSSSFFVNWADFPSIVPRGGERLAAHWLARAGEGTYAYHAMVVFSANGGRTWTEPERLHRDASPTEHGFVSLVERNGEISAVWLDGRASVAENGSNGEMALMYVSGGADSFGAEAVLDPRVCECCQTAAAATPGGLFVAYRDRTEDEIRDISYVRLADGRWSEPTTLHADGWKIPACPVNGPAVASNGKRVAVAWFTMAPEENESRKPGPSARVQMVLSSDGGETFGTPIRIDGGRPSGRVDVLWLASGAALVTWLEKTGDEAAEIRARRVRPDGTAGTPVTVATTRAARASGFPRMARAGDEILVAWTDSRKPSRIRVARLTEGGP
jgi:hypothetical protein